MTLWMVRAGRGGEHEDFALDEKLAVIGWEELPDLSGVQTREELRNLCAATYPDRKVNTIANWAGQLWAFKERMQVGDLVALPLKKRAAVALGRVRGPYLYRPDAPDLVRHARPVEWVETDIPRAAFDQDILYSLGAFMTVCRIRRNNAEERVRVMLGGASIAEVAADTSADEDGDVSDSVAMPDLEEYGRDQIRSYIGQRFKEHDLARLVNALLEAQGYQTQVSPPGPDGGVDVIAGRGPLGFDPPRICVQVKSGGSPVEAKPVRELHGVLKDFGADQALFVSWGGFKQSARTEARRRFFQVRLWDAGALVEALLEHYDRLSDEVQTELPLKRVWTLVPEE